MSLCEIRDAPLSVDEAVAAVARADAGGSALFIGTVRDNNDNRAVTLLEYEAYTPMARQGDAGHRRVRSSRKFPARGWPCCTAWAGSRWATLPWSARRARPTAAKPSVPVGRSSTASRNAFPSGSASTAPTVRTGSAGKTRAASRTTTDGPTGCYFALCWSSGVSQSRSRARSFSSTASSTTSSRASTRWSERSPARRAARVAASAAAGS